MKKVMKDGYPKAAVNGAARPTSGLGNLRARVLIVAIIVVVNIILLT